MTDRIEPIAPATGEARGSADAFLDRLQRVQARPRTIGLILAISVVLVTVGLILLVYQNDRIQAQSRMIAQQYATISQQKQILEYRRGKLDRAAAKLVATVDEAAGKARPGAALEAARQQAAIVEQEIRSDIPSGLVVALPVSVPGSTIVVGRGPNSGWDVDVFWCEGAGRDADYAIARASATILANYAVARRPLAPGVSLGRVRIRPWPERMRDGSFTGLSAVSDGGVGEDDARDAVAHILSTQQTLAFRPAHSVGTPTPYYIGVFACNGWSAG